MINNRIELREYLKINIEREFFEYFGVKKGSWSSYAVDYFWDESHQQFRVNDLLLSGVFPGGAKVLDLAGGCGQFLFAAAKSGYNCYGLEPEQWTLEFIVRKAELVHADIKLAQKVTKGVGEKMPFLDDEFDCITSYQTLEHVQEPLKVIMEMVRCTRVGGVILIRCPDYLSTFEAHYRLPWLPLMPRWLAKAYLGILGRPTKGLNSIQYITKMKINEWVSIVEKKQNCKLMIANKEYLDFQNWLRRRGVNYLEAPLYISYKIFSHVKNIFKRELSLNLVIRVLDKKS